MVMISGGDERRERQGGLVEQWIGSDGGDQSVMMVKIVVVELNVVVRFGSDVVVVVVVRLLVFYQPINVVLGAAIRGGHFEYECYAEQGLLGFLVGNDLGEE